MFKTAAIVVALAIVAMVIAILGIAVTQPGEFRVRRSIEIDAPPAVVFALIDDFRRWQEWSPYETADPAMQRSFEGPDRGTGAVYEWSGSGKAGTGRMEITYAAPARRVDIQLDMSKPFDSRSNVAFTLDGRGSFTDLAWTMDGPAPFASKLMRVFFEPDAEIGKDFGAGLERLKLAAETERVRAERAEIDAAAAASAQAVAAAAAKASAPPARRKVRAANANATTNATATARQP